MSSTITVLVLILQVLVASELSHGKSLRDLSAEEFQNLAGSTSGSFVAVYFDNAASRKSFPQTFKEFRKAVDTLDSYGIELLRLNCKGLDDLQECRETSLYTYRNGIQEDSLGLDLLFNQDSIVSNLLQSMLKNEIEFVSENMRVKEIIESAKLQNKNIVFSHVKGFGNAEHAMFTKLAFVFANDNKYDFVVTTHKDVAEKIDGLSSGGFLAAHICKGVPYESDEPCKVYTPLKKATVQTAQLLQLLQLPKYDYLADNGTSVYDSQPLSVHKAYIFTDGTNTINEDELKMFADEFYGSVGVVIVDANKHKDKLSVFGLSEKSSFPTGAFLPANPGKPESYVELFPEKSILFNLENFKHLLSEYLRNPRKQYRIDATTSSLQSITFNQFSQVTPVSSFLVDKSFLVVAFCERGSVRSECRDFNKQFRRVVRTFDRREAPEVAFVHVTLSHGGDNEIGTPKRPHIQFGTAGNVGNDGFVVFKGRPDYQGIMDYLEKKTMLSITRLPPSNSDEVPITAKDDQDKMDEQKEQEDEDAMQDEDTEQSEEHNEGEVDAPPEETEDDEVAGGAWHSEPPTVPEDKIPSLTDKTFEPTRDNNDMLVVKFFQPWDARSRALIGPYVEAAQSLGKFDVGSFSIRLARVNCFDWTDVCQNNNITTYPTIKFYRKGSDEFIYKGPLDSDNLVKTVLMLQTTSPFKLENQKQVDSFLTGKLPANSDKTSHVSVLGLFPGNGGKELKAFTEAAVQLRGSFIFGFVSGENAATIATSHGLKSPGILLIKRNDAIRSRLVFNSDFSASNIVDFVRLSSIHSFGELTPMNLPLYHKHGLPLLIAFRATAVDDNMYSPIIEKLAEEESLRNKIFLTWISMTSNDVNEVILKSYTGKQDVPVLVIVDKKKGLVFQYKNKPSLNGVVDWVNRCLAGEENPSNKLKEGRWEPLLEGYDYLAMMDKEAEAKKAKKKPEDGLEGEADEDEEATGTPVERSSRLRQPSDSLKKRGEEEKQHDEL